MPALFAEAVKERLTFDNPAWLENDKMGRWNGATPRFLTCYKQGADFALYVPRGYTPNLLRFCKDQGVRYEITDATRTLPEVDFTFRATLRAFQRDAAAAILSRRFGTLSAPTGSGKTVVALHVIAERRQPALIIIHTKELLNQWRDRIETFLEIPKNEIGIIGAGKKTVGEKITVALVQSLYKCAEEVAPNIGTLIVDECHRAPSRTFIEAVSAFDSKYMLGLSATPWRRDKLSRLIFWYVGDVVHEIAKESLEKTGDVLEADLIVRETDFETFFDPSEEYTKMLSELTQDFDRNALIAGDVAVEARNGGGVCLVLSDRKEHCRELQGLIEAGGVEASVLTGDLSPKTRAEIVERLNSGHVKVLVATGQLIGEGFDCKDLSTLFLATPIKFDGRLIQYLGRVLRPAPGKERARVFDYVDVNVGVLKASFKSRQYVYGNYEAF